MSDHDHHEQLNRIERRQVETMQLLIALQRQLTNTQRLEIIMSQSLDRLTSSVQQTTDLEQSAIQLINGLAQQVRDSAGDPAKLTELADNLDQRAIALAAALSANTPAAGPGTGTTNT